MKLYVQCPCGNTHYSGTIETINVEENVFGEDVLTYICPDTNTEMKALVLTDTTDENIEYWTE